MGQRQYKHVRDTVRTEQIYKHVAKGLMHTFELC